MVIVTPKLKAADSPESKPKPAQAGILYDIEPHTYVEVAWADHSLYSKQVAAYHGTNQRPNLAIRF